MLKSNRSQLEKKSREFQFIFYFIKFNLKKILQERYGIKT